MIYSRGGIISKREYDLIVKLINKRVYGLPSIIVYSRSFVSFTDIKEVAIRYKEHKKTQINNDEMYGLFIIENPIKENFCFSCAYINEYSFYQDESETLFFPFSCFEITDIKSDGKKEFIIYINYLGKYSSLFKGLDPKNLLEQVPQQSTYANEIIDAKIIKTTLKMPNWCYILNKSVQQKNVINNKMLQYENKNSVNQNINKNKLEDYTPELFINSVKVNDLKLGEEKNSIMENYI